MNTNELIMQEITEQDMDKLFPVSNNRFGDNADRALEKVRATYQQRHGEYADGWEKAQWVTIAAIGKKLGIELTNQQCRLLAAAAFVDVKYWRGLGGYKEDSAVDGIAYTANLISECERTLR